MNCKWKDCENEVKGKAEYCSGACRTKASRDNPTVSPEPPPTVSPVTVATAYVTVGGKCYNRQAVACWEFGSRPEPLHPSDQPVPHNRGRYKRKHGTVYQFDSGGHSFECKHPYKDSEGKSHLAVYETVADVRQAAGAGV